MSNLEKEILNSRFVQRIRDLQIDHDAYKELCAALQRLAAQWAGKKVVDREVAGALYGVVLVTAHAAQRMGEWNDPRVVEVKEMMHSLDGLVLECFGAR